MLLSSEQSLLASSPLVGLWVSPVTDSLAQQTGLAVFLTVSQVGTAPAPLLSYTSGGTIAATTYYVKQTLINLSGQEGAPSTEVSLAVPANNLLVVTNPYTLAGASYYNVYASTSTGTETLQTGGSPINIGSSWTEPTTGLITGANPPAATSGIILEIDSVDLDITGYTRPLLISSPITTTGRFEFGVGPINWPSIQGSTENQISVMGINQALPDRWQVRIYPASLTDYTAYQIAVSFIPF